MICSTRKRVEQIEPSDQPILCLRVGVNDRRLIDVCDVDEERVRRAQPARIGHGERDHRILALADVDERGGFGSDVLLRPPMPLDQE